MAHCWTEALVGLCVASFLVQCYWPAWEEEGVLLPGAWRQHQECHRFLACAFLHGSWWHLGVNIYSLWYLGRTMERLFGPGRFLYLFLGSVLGASAASVLWASAQRRRAGATAGASGAIYGLVAALAVFRVRHGIALKELWLVLLLAVVFGFTSQDHDNAGHLGGAVAGASIAYLWGPRLLWSMGRVLVRDAPLIAWPFA